MTRIHHFAFILTAALAPLAARAETLTLDQCVAIALKESPDASAANFEVEAAIARKNSARGGYSPRLRLDAGVQRWDQALSAPLFAGIVSACPDCPWNTDPNRRITQPNGAEMPAGLKSDLLTPLTLRPQWTWSVGVTLAQPIGALWTVREGNVLAKLGIDVAEIKRKSAQRDVAYQVTEAYLRLLQAMRMAEIAAKSVEQVSAQVKRAHTFFEQGTVARNDVLRAQLGLATAELRLIQAKGGVTLARGRLATLMGRPPETAIDPVDIAGGPAAQAMIAPAQAEEVAVGQRLEIKEIATRIDQATAGTRLAKSKFVPQVNALANYTRQTSSLFGLPKAWFIGATASWDLWEGGSTYYGISESKAQLAQAQEARRKAEDMIRLDVRSAHVGVTTAMEALEVAGSAVASAEENFRMEQKRYESTSNTSFDVLDAETQLTTARGQHQAAIYDLIIAKSNLARAMGERHPSIKAAQ
jgi:outer membrane protein